MMRSDPAQSLLHKNQEQFAFSPDGQPMCIYGETAHPMRFHQQADFRGHYLDPLMSA